MTEAPTTGVPAAPSASAAAPAPLSGRRRTLVWTLVVLASVLAVVATLTTWVQRQMLDNNAWHRASVQIIQEPAVRNSLSTEIVNELYSNVNVAQQLEKLFPKSLKQLAGPAAAALQEPATKAVEFMFSQPRFQQLFVQASDLAHEKLVNVLENKTGYGISTGNGVVTLNVTELLRQLGAALGVPAGALDRLPANAGMITIMKSDQLALAQDGVRSVKVLSVWLLVLVLALYGAALYLARGSRRTTLAHIGWGLVIVGLLLLVARKVFGDYVVNSLTQPEYRVPSQHIWLVATAILGQIGLETILYGLVTVAGTLVAGPSHPATALRHWLAPALNTRPELTWGTAAFVYLLVVLWGGTHALQTWWGSSCSGCSSPPASPRCASRPSASSRRRGSCRASTGWVRGWRRRSAGRRTASPPRPASTSTATRAAAARPPRSSRSSRRCASRVRSARPSSSRPRRSP